jgi:hypothetical protein
MMPTYDPKDVYITIGGVPISGTIGGATIMATIEHLAEQLYCALVLTKIDAERNGFTYGAQSNCVLALKAYDKWKSSSPPETIELDKRGGCSGP